MVQPYRPRQSRQRMQWIETDQPSALNEQTPMGQAQNGQTPVNNTPPVDIYKAIGAAINQKVRAGESFLQNQDGYGPKSDGQNDDQNQDQMMMVEPDFWLERVYTNHHVLYANEQVIVGILDVSDQEESNDETVESPDHIMMVEDETDESTIPDESQNIATEEDQNAGEEEARDEAGEEEALDEAGKKARDDADEEDLEDLENSQMWKTVDNWEEEM